MIEIKLQIQEYESEEGLRVVWEDGSLIETRIFNNQIMINANKAGLMSIAKQLIQLAQDETPVGCHYHLDEFNSLESGSSELIISKI